ncbi:TonB-dependent siderophore receptor [Marinifilum sp. D714]|uniref:TonB-dependent receptor plug domain-containing protein n=1 Tax=Marinifilum sp. D714 TaxID=2937523 RepID=UPI0027C02FB3|nr:TonB-dependent receptor [Marinifilum sp. D714]MDQ2177137.1 TonB-dependent receptor [Marinifilum sp. D714]
MRRVFVYVLLFFVISPAYSNYTDGYYSSNDSTSVYANKKKIVTVFDTILLNEVVSYGKLKKYQSGAKIETIPVLQFDAHRDGSLEQLLSRTLPITLKSTAGTLSTIRLRGTSPDHTSVNFGGINLNSLTLGQSNMSNVPMYLFDEVGVQFGSASTVNGSGSIGGAIHLGLKNNWTNGVKAEARISHGSFGEELYGAKIYLGNGKFESVTRAYYYKKDNDFKFTNTEVRDFENGIFQQEDKQRNANIENKGLIQEFNYKFSDQETLIFNLWLEKDWHLIQQNMQTNLTKPDFKEPYEDKHIRLWTSYKNHKRAIKYEISGGYVYDNGIHNSNTDDTIQTERIIGEASIEHELNKNISYKIGAKASRIYPTVYTYSSDLDYEDRVDFYASYYHKINRKLKATINLRQGLVTDYSVPFTPSLGFKYLLFSKEIHALSINGNIAKSYRVPTFNDRFWGDQGNPDLNPEKGMNYELGFKWNYSDNKTTGHLQLNAFYLNVDNWILWVNDNGWYPKNVQEVESKGLELMTHLNYSLLGLKASSGLNYTYTSTERKKSQTNSGAVGRQMEYVPLHSGNVYSTLTYKNTNLSIDCKYTDEQFTNEEDKNILSSYFLLNFSVGHQFKLNDKNRIKIKGLVNNILDADYQSTYGYAMPGVNYRLSLTYNIN